jgi:hypothetical protein
MEVSQAGRGLDGWHTIFLIQYASKPYAHPVAERTSRLRQRLQQASEEHQEQIGRLLDEKGPLIRGSFGTRSRRCGNPGCHCATGAKHTSKYLSATDEGRVRQVHVPAGDEDRVAAGVARYRRFWRMRKRLIQIGALVRELVDELGRALILPYPPKAPLPPPSRRGRKAKDGTRRS